MEHKYLHYVLKNCSARLYSASAAIFAAVLFSKIRVRIIFSISLLGVKAYTGAVAVRILLPPEALWLAEFESELLAFPYGRHDDQVDALMLFLDWFSQNEAYINPVCIAPIPITRADMGLEPLRLVGIPFAR